MHFGTIPEEYVRRSVANNLNDISKDHPGLAVSIAGERMAPPVGDDRRRLVRHALRTLTKAVDPPPPRIGGHVSVAVALSNPGRRAEPTIADLRVCFVKSNAELSPRTFRLGEVDLAPGGAATMTNRVSLAQHTTRTHHPGEHRIEVLVRRGAQGPSFVLEE